MSKILIVINGEAGVGKDTFALMTSEFLGKSSIKSSVVSSVDNVKAAARLLGWDGVKDEKGRKFLSDLKDLSTAAYDGPMRYMLSRIDSDDSKVMFFMIREPGEIRRFVDVTGAKTLLIERPSVSGKFSNHADAEVGQYSYDVKVFNDCEEDEMGDFIRKAKVYSTNLKNIVQNHN